MIEKIQEKETMEAVSSSNKLDARTIKFRGKRIDNGEWASGYLVKLYDGRCLLFSGKLIFGDLDVIEIDPKTVEAIR